MKKNIFAIFAVIAAIAISVLLLYSCGPVKVQKYSGPIERITLGINLENTPEVSALVIIAKEKGYFNDNGIDVEYTSYLFGGEAMADLVNKKLNMALASDFAWIQRAANGTSSFPVVLSIAEVDNSFLLAKKDSGITSPADLKGKKIALQKKTQSEFAFGQFLIFNGLSLNDVEIIDTSPANINNALINGQVDAVAIWDPFVKQLSDYYEGNVIQWSLQNDIPWYWVLAGDRDFINKNPETVKRFTKSLVQAEDFWNSHFEEAKKIFINFTGIDEKYASYIFQKVNPKIELPQSLIFMLENETRWSIENKLLNITDTPNYLDYIYFDALDSVKPEAISIIH